MGGWGVLGVFDATRRGACAGMGTWVMGLGAALLFKETKFPQFNVNR